MGQARQSPWGGGQDQFWSSFPIAAPLPLTDFFHAREHFRPRARFLHSEPRFLHSVDAQPGGLMLIAGCACRYRVCTNESFVVAPGAFSGLCTL
ncbi:hypothetical protein BQ8794_100041 [Mesorhizobium prunaredense]|uniref:Uncharacterized protein n=1 Tax=Mesorhizobium prunaredense TaxID=1631249 RepID=A0A1R3UZU1_9HYPH|nr:hypothetical protein BQ8794_100041 [Mesorhizobium prunaredense]